MRQVVFGPSAKAELIEALDWYKSRAPELGERFITEIDAAVARISEGPLRYSVIYKGLRRIRLHRFPYGLFYRVDESQLFVIACFHSNRDPKHWKERN